MKYFIPQIFLIAKANNGKELADVKRSAGKIPKEEWYLNSLKRQRE